MRRESRQGASAIEFAFSLLVLVPLLLGVTGLGLTMLRQLQVVQLSRDAGSMFARKVVFTDAGTQKVLSRIAGSLSLTPGSGTTGTPGSGNAVLILSTIQYVTASMCGQATPALTPGTCPNYGSWVFTKRLVIGNGTLRTSNLGTPSSVTISSTDGSISIDDQVKKAGAKVTGYNPWVSAPIESDALPIIQAQPIYVSEAAALGFRMPPFSSGAMVYSLLYF